MTGLNWREHAHDFAADGLAVFALNGGKAPISNEQAARLLRIAVPPDNEGGFHLATTDAGAIARMNADAASARWTVGVPIPSGWAVVDVDTRDDGTSALPDLLALAPTPTDAAQLIIKHPHLTTPSGGMHLFGAHVDGWRQGRRGGVDVDVKVAGAGYVKAYAGTRRILAGTPVPFPRWLVAALMPKQESAPRPYRPVQAPTDKRKRGAVNHAVRVLAESVSGSRNSTLYAQSQFLARIGVDVEEQILPAAVAAGLPEAEARRTIKSALRSELAAKELADRPRDGERTERIDRRRARMRQNSRPQGREGASRKRSATSYAREDAGAGDVVLASVQVQAPPCPIHRLYWDTCPACVAARSGQKADNLA